MIIFIVSGSQIKNGKRLSESWSGCLDEEAN